MFVFYLQPEGIVQSTQLKPVYAAYTSETKVSDLVPVAEQILDLHRSILLLFLRQCSAAFCDFIQHQELLDNKKNRVV